ncbi:MAG: thioredoxin-disulfide reductase [Clostridia bacterium]|nr:thioredoxin-disulfide reductase [Clostridia bacterium]
MKIYDMAVIGGGPGGYSAALYGARAGLSTLVIEKLSAGGQMALTHEIDNYPGFEEGIDGWELGEKMQRQAERFGAETLLAEVQSLDLGEPVKRLVTDAGEVLARTLVIATGAGPRPLGLPDEERLTARGVHYCAACDGMFYRGKTVAVVGGGNSAAADALLLSRVAKKVILVHRRDRLRATKLYHEPLLGAENVEPLWNSAVTALHGGDRLSSVTVKDLLSGGEQELEVDGVFVSIGRMPATKLFEGLIPLEGGYIVAGEDTATAVPGVYAVGDVRTKAVRQIVTAAADGAVAVHMAEGYLAEMGR